MARQTKPPHPTPKDFLLVLLASAAEETINPIQLGYGALGGDSRLGPLRAYWSMREAGILFVDEKFQIRLSGTPLAELLYWLAIFNFAST